MAWIAPPAVRQLRALRPLRASLVRLGTRLRNRIWLRGSLLAPPAGERWLHPHEGDSCSV